MAYIATPKGRFQFTQQLLFPGIQTINKEKAHENLVLLKQILDKYQLNWGLAFGSLLGAVREHDFIDWDEDIDLYILKEEEDTFRLTLWDMEEAGFELIRYERQGLYSIRRNGEYIDFYVMSKITDSLRQNHIGDYVHEEYLQERTEIDFRGISLMVPTNYDQYLTFQYGDWRTPVRFYNPQGNLLWRITVIIYYYFRKSLPDCLFFPYTRWRQQGKFAKFKEKCRKAGRPLPENLQLPPR